MDSLKAPLTLYSNVATVINYTRSKLATILLKWMIDAFQWLEIIYYVKNKTLKTNFFKLLLI